MMLPARDPNPPMDAADLIARCRQGDDLAWEALVRRYQNRVFAVALHYLRDREEARDTTQDIFVKVYRGLATLEPDRPFLPWLLRLARNGCIDRIRRLKVRNPQVSVPIDDAPELADVGPSPEESHLGDLRSRLLYRALGTLGPASREMILLKDIQELKLEEICELLTLPLGTVKSRSHRARLELAKAVQALDASYGA
jgi:RNA polymerase sigma-70 factor (ECF subfamily)